MVRKLIAMSLKAPSMWAIFRLDDLIAMHPESSRSNGLSPRAADGVGTPERKEREREEDILREIISQKSNPLADDLHDLVIASGRFR